MDVETTTLTLEIVIGKLIKKNTFTHRSRVSKLHLHFQTILIFVTVAKTEI